MELKRILARDTRSANEKAMQLYGDDVLVISTQKVGDQTELIVAIDAPLKGDSAAGVAMAAKPEAATFQSEKDEVFAEIFGFVQRQERLAQPDPEAEVVLTQTPPPPRTVLQQDSARAKPQDPPQAKAANRPPKPKAAPSKAAGKQKSVAPAAPESALAELLQMELARSREIVDLLRQEVGVLRREFALTRQVQPWESNLNMAPDVRALADQLAALSIPTGLRTLLVDAMAPCAHASAARNALAETLGSHLRACVSEPLTQGVHALIGPSGAGKTSMAVRLAHMHAAQNGLERQAIISYADKRPGAWSQLQTLAAAVGVETYRAQNAETLQILLGELADKSHIWIDTPANAHFAIAPELIQVCPALHCHAVAPMDASVASMQRLHAAATPWSSLMLTKASECDGVWHWIQALSEKPMPVACVSHSDQVTVGASPFVPDDWVARVIVELQSPSPGEAVVAKPKAAPRKRRVSEIVAHG